MEVALTKGFAAQIDAIDADLGALGWWASVNGANHVYARRGVSGPGNKKLYLHREIARRMYGEIDGLDIDHIDGDTLNCRRSNIRAVKHCENLKNIGGASINSASGILGVRWDKQRARWTAYITLPGMKFKYLGRFMEKEDAISARLAAEVKYWGIQPRRALAHFAARS